MAAETASSLLKRQAEAFGDQEFIISDEGRLTYRQADHKANSVAAGLRKLGYERGDTIAAALPNRAEYILLVFGAARAGVSVAQLNYELPDDTIEYCVNISDARGYVFDATSVDSVPHITEHCTGLDHLIGVSTLEAPDETISFEHLLEDTSGPPASDIPFTSPLQLLFTSGTTGSPKPCIFNQTNFVKNGGHAQRLLEVDGDDRVYNPFPLYHVLAFLGVFMTLSAGATMVLGKKFSKSRFWERIEKYDATVSTMHLTPANMLLQEASEGQDNNLRATLWMPATLAAEFVEAFGVEKVLTGYGATEVGGLCTMDIVGQDRAGESLDNNCGSALPDYRIQIVDKYDRQVPPGEIGEIVVRPETPEVMFDGYHNMLQETLNSIDTLWYHSGDLGEMDEAGDLFFRGRKGNAIRVKGNFVHIERVENELNEIDGVEEAAIVGVPSDIGEEAIKAVLEVVDDSLTPMDIVEHCEATLPPFMVPSYIEFLDQLPRIETGMKIDKNRLEAKGVEDAWERPR